MTQITVLYILASCWCENGLSVHHTARLWSLDIVCTSDSSRAQYVKLVFEFYTLCLSWLQSGYVFWSFDVKLCNRIKITYDWTILTKGRIADFSRRGKFNVTPTRQDPTFVCRAYWIIYSVACCYWRLNDPFCSTAHSRDCQCFWKSRTTPKIAPFHGGCQLPSNTRFLRHTRISPQLASGSVHMFLCTPQQDSQCFWVDQTMPVSCHFPLWDLDPHQTHGSLNPPESAPQMLSWLVQPFFAGFTNVTNTHTDRLAMLFVCISRLLLLWCRQKK